VEKQEVGHGFGCGVFLLSKRWGAKKGNSAKAKSKRKPHLGVLAFWGWTY
jgi:hypothetical protein